jgi:hypothetical protein
VHGGIANTVAGAAGLDEAAEAVLKWWWGVRDKHVGYMAVGGYGSVTGKKASHMTAELLIAIAKRQKAYRRFARGEASWEAHKEALRSAEQLAEMRNERRRRKRRAGLTACTRIKARRARKKWPG